MGTVKVELADDTAAYFSDMARRYQSLAVAEQHRTQADLFAAIAADYSDLATGAPSPPRSLTAIEPAAGAFARFLLWAGRWRRPADPLAAPLTLPAASTPAK